MPATTIIEIQKKGDRENSRPPVLLLGRLQLADSAFSGTVKAAVEKYADGHYGNGSSYHGRPPWSQFGIMNSFEQYSGGRPSRCQ